MELVKAPIYQQLNELLRSLMRTNEFKPGQQFLTERQICERFGVSRATANKALSNMVSEGVLEFRKGIGTFVRGDTLQYDQRRLISFTQKALDAGKSPSTQVLTFQHRPAQEAPPEVMAALKVGGNDDLVYFERLRCAGEVPVILEHRYVVMQCCPGITASDLEQSLYSLWIGRYGLEISGADQVIRAIILRGREAKLLTVPSGGAGLEVVSTGYLSNGSPLWWERTLYRGDAYEFHNRLGAMQKGQPASGNLRNIAW